jgi:hypothetical protein
MKQLRISFTIILVGFVILASAQNTTTAQKTSSAKIQVAILLDVSNSMDGLIDQAKAQLWNMVNTVGKAKCENITPKIEIALYEYGRSSNNLRDGYIKQISPFTTDLDQLSEYLFKLTTNGGDEYCSHVIFTSLQQLNWDAAPGTYKVIFIAGNEDFNQGNIAWTAACAEAKKKAVIVNTIYCGDKMQGIKEHWNLAGECGNGSYTNINQNAKIDDISTPYDSTLFVLNQHLNNTYIGYGRNGAASARKQAEMDQANRTMSKSVMAGRVAVKSNASVYQNAQWDLVDASKNDTAVLEKLELSSLPAEFKNKSRQEVKQIVNDKSIERTGIQKKIARVSQDREAFIAAERKKTNTGNVATLETEIEKIIRAQVKRFNMVIN